MVGSTAGWLTRLKVRNEIWGHFIGRQQTFFFVLKQQEGPSKISKAPLMAFKKPLLQYFLYILKSPALSNWRTSANDFDPETVFSHKFQLLFGGLRLSRFSQKMCPSWAWEENKCDNDLMIIFTLFTVPDTKELFIVFKGLSIKRGTVSGYQSFKFWSFFEEIIFFYFPTKNLRNLFFRCWRMRR